MISLQESLRSSLVEEAEDNKKNTEESTMVPPDFFSIESIQEYLTTFKESVFKDFDIDLLKLGRNKDKVLSELQANFGFVTPMIFGDDIADAMTNHIVSHDDDDDDNKNDDEGLNLLNRSKEYLATNLQEDPKGELNNAQLFFATYTKKKDAVVVLYSVDDNEVSRAILRGVAKTYE